MTSSGNSSSRCVDAARGFGPPGGLRARWPGWTGRIRAVLPVAVLLPAVVLPPVAWVPRSLSLGRVREYSHDPARRGRTGRERAEDRSVGAFPGDRVLVLGSCACDDAHAWRLWAWPGGLPAPVRLGSRRRPARHGNGSEAAPGNAATRGPASSILLVDDDVELCELLQEFFARRASGWRSFTTAGGGWPGPSAADTTCSCST